jgi:hypothetical protein
LNDIEPLGDEFAPFLALFDLLFGHNWSPNRLRFGPVDKGDQNDHTTIWLSERSRSGGFHRR